MYVVRIVYVGAWSTRPYMTGLDACECERMMYNVPTLVCCMYCMCCSLVYWAVRDRVGDDGLGNKGRGHGIQRAVT